MSFSLRGWLQIELDDLEDMIVHVEEEAEKRLCCLTICFGYKDDYRYSIGVGNKWHPVILEILKSERLRLKQELYDLQMEGE